ncbi:hypothetical protein [Streptomyces sp. LaBMicrA B280]|uniref:hypothetical protein n=1 Tax=Streptomyces sp. LaBMicrA B280 TaxID=3391001 RepID=UPI003BA775B1
MRLGRSLGGLLGLGPGEAATQHPAGRCGISDLDQVFHFGDLLVEQLIAEGLRANPCVSWFPSQSRPTLASAEVIDDHVIEFRGVLEIEYNTPRPVIPALDRVLWDSELTHIARLVWIHLHDRPSGQRKGAI